MKKQLKPAEKKNVASAGKDEEVIDLENMVPLQNQPDPNENEDDVLELTNEISPGGSKNLETGIIDLTDKVSSSDTAFYQEDELESDASDNVIQLSDMASTLPYDGADDIEEISQDVIMDFDDNNLGSDNDDLAQLTKQLESAMSDSYTDDDDTIETLPDANLINMDRYGDDESDVDLDNFDLLPEAEPGMADNIDALDLGDLEEETTFSDIGKDFEAQLSDDEFPDSEMDSQESMLKEEDVSETALELNRAMQADKANNYSDDDDDEFSDEIQNIRNKLDNVFPEDEEDPMAFFKTGNIKDPLNGQEDDDEFSPNELILAPFDENESGAPSTPSNGTPFEVKTTTMEPQTDSQNKAFGGDINLYNTNSKTTATQVESVETKDAVSNNEVEAAVQRLIQQKYGKKIEQMIAQAIEKAVKHEINKIKQAILGESGPS